MKNIIIASLVLGSSVCSADDVMGVVSDHYKDVRTSTPMYETECRDVEVPIYGNRYNDSTDDGSLIGGIAGGIIGNQVGGGSGKTAATVLGAIIGSNVGRNMDQHMGSSGSVVGYRSERRCSEVTQYRYDTRSVYDYSTITFTHNGRKQTLRFHK